jgi:hypothetical protein
MGHRQPLMEAVSRRVLNVAQGSPADLAALLEERGAAGDERASPRRPFLHYSGSGTELSRF